MTVATISGSGETADRRTHIQVWHPGSMPRQCLALEVLFMFSIDPGCGVESATSVTLDVPPGALPNFRYDLGTLAFR